MRVWVDFANTPQVLVLEPIVAALRAEGHDVVVTLRDFAQTVEVARRHGLDGPVVGGTSGDSRLGRGLDLAGRAVALMRFARRERVDIALSHNSYSQALAGRLSKLRTVTMMDYEGQPANHLAFRAAHRIVVPECFPPEALARFGATERKVVTFPGFKEQLYLTSFAPTDIADELETACDGSLDPGWRAKPLAVVRPPALAAIYHRFENPLFPELLRWLLDQDVQVVALPRSPSQVEPLAQEFPGVAVPRRAVDGPSLVASADLVVSGGGTMNREAAVLGTPAYTIFAGELPAVDRELMRLGRLCRLETIDDVRGLRVGRKRALGPLDAGAILPVVLAAVNWSDAEWRSR